MDLDDELENIENGAETEAEQIDEETELEDLEEFQDDEEDADGAGEDEDNPYDLGITKEGVAEATNDMNAIYKDGIAVAAELKDAFDDIKSAFDFSFLKQK